MKNPKAWHTHKHTTCVRIVISSTSQQRWHTRISAQSKEWALKSYCRMILDITFEFSAKGIGISKYIRLSLPSWKKSACPQTTAFSLRSTFQMLFQYKYFKDLQGNNGQSLCLTNTQASAWTHDGVEVQTDPGRVCAAHTNGTDSLITHWKQAQKWIAGSTSCACSYILAQEQTANGPQNFFQMVSAVYASVHCSQPAAPLELLQKNQNQRRLSSLRPASE